MSNVSVSRDALHSVKTAFRDFQTSVETATDHMKSHAEEIITSTRASIKKQQAVAESLKSKVTSLSADIEQCQAQIISNNNQLCLLKSSIANASSRSNGLDNQIAQLNAQKQRLLSQNSSNGDNSNDNSAQVHAIENQIQSCERQRRQLNEQIASMRGQESSLNAQNVKLRDDKTRLDSTLATAKNELSKAIEKSEKLKSAGTTVESSVNSFLGVAQQFKQTAMITSSTGQSGIEKCIAAIDEYEAVNLGVGRYDTGSTFSSYEQRLNRAPKDTERWESGIRGEGLCTTTNDEANAVLASYGLRGVIYHNALPDFSPFAAYTVEIGNMQGGERGRDNVNTEFGGVVGNFSQADRALAAQLSVSIQEVRALRMNHDPPLTWHERNDTHTMDLIPTIINSSFGHYGGTAESNAIRNESHSADELLDAVADNIPNAMDYSENQEAHDVTMEETPPVSRGPVDLRF